MRRQRGFSLVELLVAILILTIVITTSLFVFAQRKRRLTEANETVLAYQALANEAEMRRRIPYGQLTDTAYSPTEFLSDTQLLKPLEPYTTIVSVQDSETADVREVRMTIRWQAGKKQARLTVLRSDTGGSNLW